MEKEIKALRQWIADLLSGMYVNCVYCGHRYGPVEATPVSMADQLTKHIEDCPRHPLALLRQSVKDADEVFENKEISEYIFAQAGYLSLVNGCIGGKESPTAVRGCQAKEACGITYQEIPGQNPGDKPWVHMKITPKYSMDFSDTLKAMKAGKKVYREAWRIWYIERRGKVFHKTYINNTYLPGYYTPTVEDLLADDWMIVE